MTTPPAVTVTVVVINYRTPELTSGIVRQIRSTWGSIPVVVCDNSDDKDEWRALSAQLDNDAVTIRADRNLGFGAGVNLVMTDASTEYALLVNPDLLDLPDLDRLLRTAAHTGAAVTAPVVGDSSGHVTGTFGGRPKAATFARYVLPLPGGARSLMASRVAAAGRRPMWGG